MTVFTKSCMQCGKPQDNDDCTSKWCRTGIQNLLKKDDIIDKLNGDLDLVSQERDLWVEKIEKLTETLSAKDDDIKELSEALMDAANNMISNKLMDKYLAIASKFLI